MRILLIHADHFEYEVKQKAIKNPEEIVPAQKKDSVDDALIVFCTVEKTDEKDPEQTAAKSVESIVEVADSVKSRNIMLYPYAHLSPDLGSGEVAMPLLKRIEESLKDRGFNVKRSPFGWYKSFEIKCKGHPLSELSRTITPQAEEESSQALLAEERLKSTWHILKPNGKLTSVDSFDFTNHRDLERFMRYEVAKSREVRKMPPHVTLMKKLEIAGHEPGSDPGNLRWYPKGKLIKSLIEQYVTEKTLAYGAVEVETPIMYDVKHPSLSDYLRRFPARQYVLESGGRDFFLRFSACFGQFLMLHDAQISYKQLPLKIYELTRYSFRKEKRGELVGLRRLRAFTMPDCHAICLDLNQALEEAKVRFELCIDVLDGLGLDRGDFELGVRLTKAFYNENKDFIISIVKLMEKPALIEMWDDQFFYFIFKWEFNFVDNMDKASALSTDQIDTENSKRYEITYTDEKGESEYPLILHCSPSGAIERCIYAILEKAYRRQKEGKIPIMPLWLAPTQARIIPVTDSFLNYAEELSRQIEDQSIRVDVDDRSLSVSKKIRDAEMDWINYILVVGQKEVDTEVLAIRDRSLGKMRKSSLKEFVKEVKEKTQDKPFKPMTLQKLLTKRPQIGS